MRVINRTWSRLKPAQKVGLIVAALAVLGGGAAVIGGLAGGGDSAKAPAAQVQAPAESAAASPSASTKAPRGTVKRTVTETEPIKFKSRTVKDSWLPEGEREQRTVGIDGERTLTYAVTLVDGRETARKLVKSEVTRKPVDEVVAVGIVATADDANG